MTPPSPSVDRDARRTGRRSRGWHRYPRPVAPSGPLIGSGCCHRPAVEVVLPRPTDQDAEAPNASPARRMDSLPLVPLTMTASAWKSAPPVRDMGFLSPHHGLTCSVRDCSLASKVASPL